MTQQLARPATRTCTVVDSTGPCEKSVYVRGMCAMHVWRLRKLGTLEKRPTTVTVQCQYCGGDFEAWAATGTLAKYCSRECRRGAHRYPVREADEGTLPPDNSPEVWNGVAMYSVVPERKEPYDRRCLLCGRDQGDTLWLTGDEARNIRGGLPRCSWRACGGFVQLELATGGVAHSPVRAASTRTRAKPVRTVPRSGRLLA